MTVDSHTLSHTLVSSSLFHVSLKRFRPFERKMVYQLILCANVGRRKLKKSDPRHLSWSLVSNFDTDLCKHEKWDFSMLMSSPLSIHFTRACKVTNEMKKTKFNLNRLVVTVYCLVHCLSLILACTVTMKKSEFNMFTSKFSLFMSGWSVMSVVKFERNIEYFYFLIQEKFKLATEKWIINRVNNLRLQILVYNWLGIITS